ncbi:unnamed protein product [Thelazia callipaeda]|uniref:Skp1 domain-containing protein n=1 Tax=Thelazia callipaeda TaxID=103827 RepID=A0A0N5CTK7_THECL|nr:unnamed protein product [Thelazia callipaeda]
MDTNPERSSACLDYKSRIVDQVLIFAFSGICEVKYSGGDFQSRDFNDFREFLSCLNLLKPLMYKELLQTYDESYCHKFQNLCNTSRPPCEANTIQFLRLAVRWGFRRLEACTIARIVDIFSKTYYLHLNVDEQPHVVQELIKYQLNYEMDCEEEDKWMVEELSPLEGIELLKAKCKQVSKWIGEGFKTDLPEPKTPPLPVEPRESAYDKYRRDITAYRRSQQRQT